MSNKNGFQFSFISHLFEGDLQNEIVLILGAFFTGFCHDFGVFYFLFGGSWDVAKKHVSKHDSTCLI